jgi:hypothetical protein
VRGQTEEREVEVTDPIDVDTTTVIVRRGDIIPVEVDCDGVLEVSVDGESQLSTEVIDTFDLEVGAHDIRVTCDDEPVVELTATVFDQRGGGTGTAASMTIVLLLVLLAGGITILGPSGGMAAVAAARRH